MQFFSYTLNSNSRAQSKWNYNSAESKPQGHVAVPAMVTLPPVAGSKFIFPVSQNENELIWNQAKYLDPDSFNAHC